MEITCIRPKNYIPSIQAIEFVRQYFLRNPQEHWVVLFHSDGTDPMLIHSSGLLSQELEAGIDVAIEAMSGIIATQIAAYLIVATIARVQEV